MNGGVTQRWSNSHFLRQGAVSKIGADMDLFRRRRIEAHIDMTPMIDTLLQLFLIFMLGTTLASSTIDLNLPQAKKAATASDISKAVIVSIDADNRLYLDNRHIPRSMLQTELQTLLQHSKELTVLLQADRKLIYEQIVQVMVEIRETGATRILLAYHDQK